METTPTRPVLWKSPGQQVSTETQERAGGHCSALPPAQRHLAGQPALRAGTRARGCVGGGAARTPPGPPLTPTAGAARGRIWLRGAGPGTHRSSAAPQKSEQTSGHQPPSRPVARPGVPPQPCRRTSITSPGLGERQPADTGQSALPGAFPASLRASRDRGLRQRARAGPARRGLGSAPGASSGPRCTPPRLEARGRQDSAQSENSSLRALSFLPWKDLEKSI